MNPWIIRVRSFARGIGVVRFLNRMRSSQAYEQRVHEALKAAVRPNDIVWDVGANVGLYSELFCEWVGEGGQVVAFEPSPESCARIRQRLHDRRWLRIENVALGQADGTGHLVPGTESTQDHVETGPGPRDNDAIDDPASISTVTICRGDSLSGRLGKIPNVVKIDVEGYELEVLRGMGDMLKSPALRGLLVEVHFAKLEQRRMRMAPSHLQRLLKDAGFQTKWVDASHLFAYRQAS